MTLIKSWYNPANDAEGSFPVNNLPYGVFEVPGQTPTCCTALGDAVVNLGLLESTGLIAVSDSPLFSDDTLNTFMASGPDTWKATRKSLVSLLQDDGDDRLKNDKALQSQALIPMNKVNMLLPMRIGDYTDFYSSRQHAENVGTLLRGKENALAANWLHIPIAYNGRASTVVISGTDVRRPLGQTRPPNTEAPLFGPSKRLDIELEMGVVVGTGNTMGEPITTQEAREMIFGFVLLNDWSARDIQAWEYQPLGPFQAKAFATSISPWIVTSEALNDFMVDGPAREKPLLPYLLEQEPSLYNIKLDVFMQPAETNTTTQIASSNYKNMYYSPAQQLTHHAIGGCKMNPGDLLGSGTISGDRHSAFGSLLEITEGGKRELTLDCGTRRKFIEDGDRLTLTGYAEGDGYRLGFGECSATILPAPTYKRT